MEPHHTHPSYPSLNKPLLLFGCPRLVFAVGVALACVWLMASGHSTNGVFISVGIGAGVWLAGAAAVKIEPRFIQVAELRLVLRATRYDAARREVRK